MFWNRRNKDPAAAELKINLDQWVRTAECAERREMRLRAEFEKVIDKIDALYAVVFPGIEHTEDVLETVDAIDRYITAQATELKALREKIVEASDIRETAQRTQELVLEISDAVAIVRGALLEESVDGDSLTFAQRMTLLFSDDGAGDQAEDFVPGVSDAPAPPITSARSHLQTQFDS